MKARFLWMSFVRAEPALPFGSPLSLLGLARGKWERKPKTSPCWQCDTHGEILAGTRFSNDWDSATLAADFDEICIDDGGISTTGLTMRRIWMFICERSRFGSWVGWLRNRCPRPGRFWIKAAGGRADQVPGPILSWSQSFVLVRRLGPALSVGWLDSAFMGQAFVARG